MPKLKKYKPYTAGLRHRVVVKRSNLAKKSKAPRALITKGRKVTGRNNMGRITIRHRGGGVKRNYRMIDFKRDKYDIQGVISSIEYDPNRTANVALIKYSDGEWRFILAPKGLKVGSKVISGREGVPLEVGNAMPLSTIPSGVYVHNVEINPGKGGKLGRSAGQSVQVQGKSGRYVQVKMPSGEIRLIHGNCLATIGAVGNDEHLHAKIGKAGISRKMGRRPEVRGVAMYAQVHPHGGGEGKTGTGGPAKDKWGNLVGKRTRRNRRTQRFIVKRRSK